MKLSMNQKQLNWDLYYLKMADTVSSKSPCVKRKVGCVLVKNNMVKGTGFNWRPAQTDCDNEPCKRLNIESGLNQNDNLCCNHSEMNLLTFTSYEDRVGGTLYLTDAPCQLCSQLILGSQISRLVYYYSSNPKHNDGIELIKKMTAKSKRVELVPYNRFEEKPVGVTAKLRII